MSLKYLKFKQCDAFECVRYVPRFEILPLFGGKVTEFLVANRYTPLPIDQYAPGTYGAYYWV